MAINEKKRNVSVCRGYELANALYIGSKYRKKRSNTDKEPTISLADHQLSHHVNGTVSMKTKLSKDIFDVQNIIFYLHSSIIIIETTREDALRI